MRPRELAGSGAVVMVSAALVLLLDGRSLEALTVSVTAMTLGTLAGVDW